MGSNLSGFIGTLHDVGAIITKGLVLVQEWVCSEGNEAE